MEDRAPTLLPCSTQNVVGILELTGGRKVAAGGRPTQRSQRDQPHVCPEGNWTEMPENREALTPCGSPCLFRPLKVKVRGGGWRTRAGLGFPSAAKGLYLFILCAWDMSWETVLSIF